MRLLLNTITPVVPPTSVAALGAVRLQLLPPHLTQIVTQIVTQTVTQIVTHLMGTLRPNLLRGLDPVINGPMEPHWSRVRSLDGHSVPTSIAAGNNSHTTCVQTMAYGWQSVTLAQSSKRLGKKLG
jgi:hypothetical protein